MVGQVDPQSNSSRAAFNRQANVYNLESFRNLSLDPKFKTDRVYALKNDPNGKSGKFYIPGDDFKPIRLTFPKEGLFTVQTEEISGKKGLLFRVRLNNGGEDLIFVEDSNSGKWKNKREITINFGSEKGERLTALLSNYDIEALMEKVRVSKISEMDILDTSPMLKGATVTGLIGQQIYGGHDDKFHGVLKTRDGKSFEFYYSDDGHGEFSGTKKDTENYFFLRPSIAGKTSTNKDEYKWAMHTIPKELYEAIRKHPDFRNNNVGLKSFDGAD